MMAKVVALRSRLPGGPHGARWALRSLSSSSSTSSPANSDVVLAFADGASRGNPGRAGCGALLLDAATGKVLASAAQFLGERETNNAAEYRGLLLALQLARQHEAARVRVHMDSQLVVRQMRGEYRVKNAKLRLLFDDCQRAARELELVEFEHVPREQNALADALANEAIDSTSAPQQDTTA